VPHRGVAAVPWAVVLAEADDALAVAEDTDGLGLEIEKAVEVLRPVDGADRPAVDALFRASRPRQSGTT